jgi:hypothetical protein
MTANGSQVRLLVGTRKGAFILTADAKRDRNWQIAARTFAGWEIYHLKGSPADPNRLYASQSSGWFGQLIQRSDDGGQTWAPVGNKFAYNGVRRHPPVVRRHRRIHGSSSASGTSNPHSPTPTTSMAGVEDAALFHSTDGGQNWAELSGLRTHTTGSAWQPGAGGMCLHTILLDPTRPAADRHRHLLRRRLPHRRRRRHLEAHQPRPALRAYSRPARRVGHCVHHIAAHPSRPGVLFMQKHWDVMRSDDAGDHWHEVSGNLPTDFGFAIDVHAHEPETLYVVPIKSDSEHFVPDGKLRVFRSRSGGNDWEPLTKGLPQQDCYVNILRDAMAVDTLDSCGVYFGTSGGQVYASSNSGDTWNAIVRDLPPVLSVEVQTMT